MTMSRFSGDDVLPDDIFFVDPFQIELGKDAQDLPVNEILDMAISMHRYGQRRPVECHLNKDNRLVLHHGLVRTVAAKMICNGFERLDSETNANIKVKDKRFKLKVLLTSG